MPKPNLKDRLLESGLATLHGKGFNATSVQDITDAAGAPKGSFYNHFESKEALGAEAVRVYVQRAGEHLAVLHDKTSPPTARLRAYFERLAGLVAADGCRRGCLLGNFALELSGQSAAIRAEVAAGLEGWSRSVAGVVEEGQEALAIPGRLPPAELAACVIDAWEGAVMRARAEQRRQPLDRFLQTTLPKLLA